MKFNNIKLFAVAILASMTAINCSNDDDNTVTPSAPDFAGTYVQEDQMGRPAINTVFVNDGMKDAFNTTTPSDMGALFQSAFQTKLETLSPAYDPANPDDANALGFTAAQFTGVLATDVLTVSLDAPTTFFDGTNILTGRNLTDDVIDVELILIFGGEEGLTNPEYPGLVSDSVSANDKDFLTSFPYLASPW
ncbi:DUF4331 family protein [Winogradskyella psychrotolerans]|uniref:DUF4331 family protein n=1 Tax=Winogradskyella psychrotolerans TaxID=1344585 RepID=UPI001C06C5C4|nr:DUF4331 family protein [Winogradskyella psychrotolerans]MBU2930277.1 DUF4331 domain-containing protein [Winogradskyella psychrotolerans]